MRRTLVALLIASTALFTAGVIAERSAADTHAEPASAHVEGAGGEAAEGEAVPEQDERVLGVDLESTPLVVLAVLAGLGLAVLAASRLGTVPGIPVAIAVVAFAWAVLDVRELVHQVDESRTGIAVVALFVAVLHLAAAAVSARLARDA